MVDLSCFSMCNSIEIPQDRRYKLATRQIIQAHMYSYPTHCWLTECLKIYKLAAKNFVKLGDVTNIYISSFP